jgi:hypothetical protein
MSGPSPVITAVDNITGLPVAERGCRAAKAPDQGAQGHEPGDVGEDQFFAHGAGERGGENHPHHVNLGDGVPRTELVVEECLDLCDAEPGQRPFAQAGLEVEPDKVEPDGLLVLLVGVPPLGRPDDLLQPVVEVRAELPRAGRDRDVPASLFLEFSELVTYLVARPAIDEDALFPALDSRHEDGGTPAAILALNDGPLAIARRWPAIRRPLP